MTFALFVSLLLQALAAAPAEIRSLPLVITTAKGEAVSGLTAEEVAVLENGVAREIVKLEPDTRPLSVVLLVDSSEELGSIFRLYLVDAVAKLIEKLPEGAKYTLWTTGDRPRRIVEWSDDRSLAKPALKRVIPQGGNTLLDGLVEASRDLRAREGERGVVLAVTGRTSEFSSRDRYRVVEDARKNAERFDFVIFEEGNAPFDNRAAYDFVIDNLVRKSGGRVERPISAMATAQAGLKLVAELAAGYRVSYTSVPEIKERRIEVQVSRPGLKVRVGPSAP